MISHRSLKLLRVPLGTVYAKIVALNAILEELIFLHLFSGVQVIAEVAR